MTAFELAINVLILAVMSFALVRWRKTIGGWCAKLQWRSFVGWFYAEHEKEEFLRSRARFFRVMCVVLAIMAPLGAMASVVVWLLSQ